MPSPPPGGRCFFAKMALLIWGPIMAVSLEGLRWPDDHITWSFAVQTFTEDAAYPFTRSIEVEWQHVIEQAFARWAAVSGLTFEEVADAPDHSHAADIRIAWGEFGATATTIGLTAF